VLLILGLALFVDRNSLVLQVCCRVCAQISATGPKAAALHGLCLAWSTTSTISRAKSSRQKSVISGWHDINRNAAAMGFLATGWSSCRSTSMPRHASWS
jgi:hypothetical protein